MKILVITRGKLPLPNIKGGAVEYLIQQILDENEKNWHHNITICGPWESMIESYQICYKYTDFLNIKINSLYAKVMSGIRYIINRNFYYIGNYFLSKIIARFGDTFNEFDAILIENAFDFIPVIRKSYNGRIIFHGHNDWVNSENVDNLIYCDEYWAISNFLAEKARKMEAQCSIYTLYNGICLEDYTNILSEDVQLIREKYGLHKEDFIFVFTGRVVKEKGVLELIRAFILCQFQSDVKLLIVGGIFYSSDKESNYIKECKEIAKGYTNIIFTGYVSYNKIKLLYQCAHVGCALSLCHEAFGLSILEMLASGLPVITTNNGAISEVANCESAFLFDSDNINFEINVSKAMTQLFTDSTLRKKMSHAAIKQAEKFANQIYLDNFRNLLEKGGEVS